MRLAGFSLATIWMLGAAACVEPPDSSEAALELASEEERHEIALSYDVASGRVEVDVEGSLAALRQVGDREPIMRGTDGPPLDEAEDAPRGSIVFGVDSRVKVNPTTSFPALARVRIVATFSDGYETAGSGIMIGDRYVLTAGHVIYNNDHGAWATKTMVFPGQNGDDKPYKSHATNLRVVMGWTHSENSDYDYGLITLAKPLGNSTGTYCLGSFSDSTLQKTTAHVYGYPGDKPKGTQWGMGGPIEDFHSKQVFYDMDTNGGQSGSGVYRFYNGQRCVFAVHNGYGLWWFEQYNRATRITNARFHLIKSWMASGI